MISGLRLTLLCGCVDLCFWVGLFCVFGDEDLGWFCWWLRLANVWVWAVCFLATVCFFCCIFCCWTYYVVLDIDDGFCGLFVGYVYVCGVGMLLTSSLFGDTLSCFVCLLIDCGFLFGVGG